MVRVACLSVLLAVNLAQWEADYRNLQAHHLVMPVLGVKSKEIIDTYNDERGGGRTHEATDILAPRGTPVVAIDNGIIEKLFTSVRGGLTIYQFDPTETYCYYYAHLDRYATGVTNKMPVHRGQIIGYVGTTGDAPPNTPHLHFEITRLDADKKWWHGKNIDPYPLLKAIEK